MKWKLDTIDICIVAGLWNVEANADSLTLVLKSETIENGGEILTNWQLLGFIAFSKGLKFYANIWQKYRSSMTFWFDYSGNRKTRGMDCRPQSQVPNVYMRLSGSLTG